MIEQLPELPPSQSETDLHRLSNAFPDLAAPELTGDGTLALLTADTEIVAADALASWLAAGTEEDNAKVTFVLGKDTALLDNTLTTMGLPRLGNSAHSAHRALLQVLPLTFALAWQPPDPNRLLDFLLLPIGPLSRSAANKLAAAVIEAPGIGGDVWLAAWDAIANNVPDGSDPKKHAERVAAWREFVEPERHDPEKGMPRGVAKGIAERVYAWAVKRSATEDDMLLHSLAQIARELSFAIDATEVERLDRVLVERMIEQSVGIGASDPKSLAEAAPWRAVDHPGAIWGEAGTIVWWHFADIDETRSAARWNELERSALWEAGCPLDEPEVELRRLAAGWERPLRLARDRLLLVRPSLAGGDETTTHPLWHSLAARKPDIAKLISVRAETILHDPSPALAGRALARLEVPIMPASDHRPIWMAPAGKISVRKFESASSLETLLTCPLKWTLKYGSKLRSGARQALPGIEKTVGVLVHRIAEEAFPPGTPPDPGTVELFAARRFDELLPQMAATLLLPGSSSELAAARRSVPLSLAKLARFLHSERLTVTGVESKFEVEDTLAEGVGVDGRIDLRAETIEGRQVVVDLKWYKSDKYVRDDLKRGTALQIAVYSRHVSDERVDVAAGYYMLRQQQFFTSGALSGDMATVVAGPTPKETWEKMKASFAFAMADLEAGTVRSAYTNRDTKPEKFADPYLLTKPNCKRCDFSGICGANP